MNKNDLIASVMHKTRLAKVDAADAVNGVLQAIESSLRKGDRVRLADFGTFLVVKRGASEGRNPRTGAKIMIAAQSAPKFRPGKGLKEAVSL